MIYEPEEDSLMIKRHIKDYIKKDANVLDLGTGSAILAAEANKFTKNVLAVDLAQDAMPVDLAVCANVLLVCRLEFIPELVNHLIDILHLFGRVLDSGQDSLHDPVLGVLNELSN